MAQLSIRELRKNYASFEALKNINLEIPKGEFVVFVGPSGCGKSTLLRTIAGLETISSGEIELDGRLLNDVEPSKRELAMVFQSYALYPHLSVRENMAYSLKLMGLSKAEINEKVNTTAEKLQLTAYLDRKPAALSGGQRQRVAIGRAIVRNPKVFLFDEPLSNLDAALRVQMRLEISNLNETLKDTTMIYVTHDQVEAMTMADRIVVLRDGRIEQVGSPMELYERPNSVFVAQFIGSPKMNVFTGERAADFDASTVGIRPEHVVVSANGPWSGQVIRSEQLGADSFIYIDTGGEEPFVLRETGQTALRGGQMVNFGPVPEHLHRFDDNGRALGGR